MTTSSLIKKHEHGVGLLEALISVALSSIVILGAAYSMGRMLTSQQQVNFQYIVKNELQTRLQNATVEQKEKWCNKEVIPTIVLPKDQSSTVITVECETVDITVNNEPNNKTIPDIKSIKFKINSPLLGGDLTMGEYLK